MKLATRETTIVFVFLHIQGNVLNSQVRATKHGHNFRTFLFFLLHIICQWYQGKNQTFDFQEIPAFDSTLQPPSHIQFQPLHHLKRKVA